jgi:hypothetical protein
MARAVVNASHGEPGRDVNDAKLVENVRNQGDAEQRDGDKREPQQDAPQFNVALRTKLGRARSEHAM